MPVFPLPTAASAVLAVIGVGSAVLWSAAPADASTASVVVGSAKVVCSSKHDGLASQLSKDIADSLSGKGDSIALAVSDRDTGTTCTYRPDATFDSASVVKVTVLGALLRQAQDEHRGLTQQENQLAHDMITKSDNDSTSALWRQIGPERFQHFLDLADMRNTEPGPGTTWGLTQITAGDQLKLLHLLHFDNEVLNRDSRSYALKLMAQVVPDQRWGVPAGAPENATAHIKNGWLPRATNGWRVHSIGAFTGEGHAYDIVVLSHNNRTMQDGINTLETTAAVINRYLAQDTAT